MEKGWVGWPLLNCARERWSTRSSKEASNRESIFWIRMEQPPSLYKKKSFLHHQRPSRSILFKIALILFNERSLPFSVLINWALSESPSFKFLHFEKKSSVRFLVAVGDLLIILLHIAFRLLDSWKFSKSMKSWRTLYHPFQCG